MKNITLFCSLIALTCVSTASVFNIVLSMKQIDEINLVQEKRMKLNAYFRREFSFINWRHRERLSGDSKRAFDENYLASRESDIKKEMRRYGYTTPEIESLQQSADFLGAMQFYTMHEEEYRRELKELGRSAAEIEEAIGNMRSTVLESRKPFSLRW